VAAYDAEMDRQGVAAALRAKKTMSERHAKAAGALLAKGFERLKRIDPDELAPTDALRFVAEAIRLERLALGEPDAIGEQRIKGDPNHPLAVSTVVREVLVTTRQEAAAILEAARPQGGPPADGGSRSPPA
jgi:hypothetical protein